MNFSSNGAGSSGHIVGELLKRKFGFEAAHVPQGGDMPIINSLMGDHVQLGIIAAPPTEPFVRDRKIKAIAVTSAKRTSVLPEVPTLVELGLPDVVASTWFSFVTPAGVPRPIVELLNREINAAMKSPDVEKIFKNGGLEPIFMSVPEYETFVKSEQEKWGEIVKTLGISIEQ
jgi:tripartite-type tricarboxylate transporter receptor subunit TctC